MIDITLCDYEESNDLFDGTKVTYFCYPQDKLFCGELQKLFKRKDEYESQFGPVVSACLCIECFPNGEKVSWLSPTCEVDYCFEDVDHVDISLTDNEIEGLLLKASNKILIYEINETLNRLEKSLYKLKKHIETMYNKVKVEVESNE